MKKIFFSFLSGLLLLSIVSCDNDTQKYADQLKAQDKLIEEFIQRENIKVLKSFPTTWNENDYVKTASGLYFHLVNAGEGDTIRTGDEVIIRYKQKTLVENAILEEYWTTQDAPHPTTLYYNINPQCLGWNEAIGYMKRHNAHCKIIVPSTISFTNAQNSVTPYFFELKISFHK